MQVSNDLAIDTRMNKLALIDTQVPVHSSFIQGLVLVLANSYQRTSM